MIGRTHALVIDTATLLTRFLNPSKPNCDPELHFLGSGPITSLTSNKLSSSPYELVCPPLLSVAVALKLFAICQPMPSRWVSRIQKMSSAELFKVTLAHMALHLVASNFESEQGWICVVLSVSEISGPMRWMTGCQVRSLRDSITCVPISY